MSGSKYKPPKPSETPCLICSSVPTDRCHIKSKGSGGTRDSGNIIMLCRKHHAEQHQSGWNLFLKKYPTVGRALKRMGYEIEEVFGVMKLVKK